MANLFQPSLQRATDSNGRPVSGAKMWFYSTGTTTPATWFTDHAGLIQGSNPLPADGSGKFATPAFLDPDTTYRVRLTQSDGETLIWPDVDPVRGYDEGMVQTAAEGALTAAISAGIGATATAADRTAVAADRTAVATDKATVAGYRTDTLAARDEALAFGNTPFFATWTELAALTGMAAGDKAVVIAADDATHTDPVAGGTVSNSGYFVYSASPAGWERVGDLESQLAQTAAALSQDAADTVSAAANEVAIHEVVLDIAGTEGEIFALPPSDPTSAGDATTNFRVWGAGYGLAADTRVATISVYLNKRSADHFRFRVYKRADAGSTTFPDSGTTPIAFDQTFAVADVLHSGDGNLFARYDFPIGSMLFEAGKELFWIVEGRASGATTPISIGNSALAVTDVTDDRERGYTLSGVDKTIDSQLALVTTGFAKAWRLSETTYSSAPIADHEARLETLESESPTVALVGTEVSGWKKSQVDQSASGINGQGPGISTRMWGAGHRFTAATRVNALWLLLNLNGAVTIDVRLYTRSGTGALAPPQTSDVVVETKTFTVAEVYGGPAGIFSLVKLSFADIALPANTTLLWKAIARDGSGVAVPFGVATSAITVASLTNGYDKGYVAASGTTLTFDNTVPTAVSSGYSLAWSFVYQELVSEGDALRTTSSIHSSALAASGLVVSGEVAADVRGTSMQRRRATLSATLDAAATGSNTVSMTMKFNTYQYTPHRHLTNVVVTRVSDSVVLSPVTDYILGADGGIIVGLVNTANFAISVAYDYKKERYDTIGVNPETMALTVVKGTERLRDACEYLGSLPVGCLPLANAKVIGGTIGDGLGGLIPTWRFRAGTMDKLEQEREWWREYNRRALPGLSKALRNGSPVTVIGYGDSWTASPGLGFFAAMPSDTLALYTTQQLVELAIPYQFANHIKADYASTITYVNKGIGSTTAETGFKGGNPALPNGQETARLADFISTITTAVGAGQFVVVVQSFAMNDRTTSNIAENNVAIMAAAQAAGAEVILTGCGAINAWLSVLDDMDVTWTCNRKLEQAALYSNAAWVDHSYLLGYPSHYGNLGLSRYDHATAQFNNHPGIYEFKRLGRNAIELIGL